MKNFKKGGSFGGRGGFNKGGSGRQSFGGSSRDSRPFKGRGSDKPAMMHAATCSKCNSGCEVPFIPNGRKPVLCKDCYAKSAPTRDDVRDDGRNRYESRRPSTSFQKKDFSSDRSYDRPRGSFAEKNTDDTARQLAGVNAKLDILIQKIDLLLQD